MKNRTFVSLALAVAFVLVLAAPALAQTHFDTSASYSYELKMDGTIDQQMQIGHVCNSGAELKQTIMGTGTLTKVLDATMVQHKLTVSDTNDFVTAANAVRNLTITSVIELCAPAKMTYEDTDDDGYTFDGVVHPGGWYVPDTGDYPRYWIGWSDLGFIGYNNPQEVFQENDDDDLTLGKYEELTKQIWAVQVEAKPGFSGALHQKFEAAYGPYYGVDTIAEDDDMPDGYTNYWGWQFDEYGNRIVAVGDNYVGNYFNIDQFARTSQGVVKRYISVSSPWSHGYLMVDSSIEGRVEATDKFSMDNIEAGSDAADNWWTLF